MLYLFRSRTMGESNADAQPGTPTMENLIASCQRATSGILLLLLALCWPMAAAASTPPSKATLPATQAAQSETAKIQALIGTVEKSHGLVFIRNGSAHEPVQAASHLRLKWKNAGKRVRTAEDFIRYCATGSSISGKPYQIRHADGRIENSADYFRAQLRRIEAGQAKAGTAKP